MPTFRYEALDDTGQSCSGEIEADDASRAASLLVAQSLVVISIELMLPPEPPVTSAPAPGSSQTYEQRIDEALRQPEELARMLRALAAEPASAGLRKQLNYLLVHLDKGIDAQKLLSDERLCAWLPIIMSMSSQRSMAMEARYSQLLTQILDERTRRRSLIATFSYPLMLLGFALLVLVPICVFIVPTFQRMFMEFGLTLPSPTRLLFSIANLVNYYPHYLILSLLSLIGLFGLVTYAWVSRALTTRLFGWLIAGNSVSLVAMSRLTSVLAELLELGAPLSESLILAGRASRHAYFREAAQRLAVHLTDPNFSWQASPVAHNFPLTLLHALSAGEGHRASVPLIRELSHIYSHRVSARLNKRTGITSPLMVIGVGLAVGLVVISLFMPLVQMITSLT